MPIRFRSVLAVEGLETSDRRIIMPNALTWRDLPIPLMGLTEDNHGGMDNTSVNIGRIESIVREDAADLGDGVFRLVATGVLDDADPVGAEFARKIGEKYLRGVSVDVGDVTAEMEVLEEDEDGWPLVVLDRLTAGRIGMATVCGFPAFAEAYIELADEPALVAAAALPASDLTLPQTTGPAWGALVAAAAPSFAPPADWFTDPHLTGPTALTITDDGRVFGHVALWGVEHLGIPGAFCPRSQTDYAHFRTGEVICADGTAVAIGKLTAGIGHADLHKSPAATAEHYDRSDAVWAYVTAGEDEWGPWVAGTVAPDVDERRLAQVRACGLSGDWRRIGGNLEMVAALSVPVGGFPIPRSLAASGQTYALVAAGGQAVLAASKGRSVTEEAQRGFAEGAALMERRGALRAVVADSEDRPRATFTPEQTNEARRIPLRRLFAVR